MAKLSAIKTLAGSDFAFQPSLDKNRVLALAGLQFSNRAEAVHLIGPPGTGKTDLSLALGVEAVKAERSVYFSSLADIVASLAKAESDGALRERIPILRSGRHSHRNFRGVLRLHSRYCPLDCSAAQSDL